MANDKLKLVAKAVYTHYCINGYAWYLEPLECYEHVLKDTGYEEVVSRSSVSYYLDKLRKEGILTRVTRGRARYDLAISKSAATAKFRFILEDQYTWRKRKINNDVEFRHHTSITPYYQKNSWEFRKMAIYINGGYFGQALAYCDSYTVDKRWWLDDKTHRRAEYIRNTHRKKDFDSFDDMMEFLTTVEVKTTVTK